MICLIKLEDNKFVWSKGKFKSEVMSAPEAKAYGYWTYKIDPKDISLGLEYMAGVSNAAVFDEVSLMLIDFQTFDVKNTLTK